MDSAGRLVVAPTIGPGSNTGLGGVAATSLGKAEDNPHANGDTGVMALAVRNDGEGTEPCSANGDYSPISVDNGGRVIVRHAGTWTVVHDPGVNTLATASKAAGGASVKHVCTAILVTLSNDAAAVAFRQVNLRDGASGAGTILWTGRLAIPATNGSSARIELTGLNIVGSANTAMTLEFSGAGGANTYETVSMSGYSTK